MKGNKEEAIKLLGTTKLKLREIAEKTGVPMGTLGGLSLKYRSMKMPATPPPSLVGKTRDEKAKLEADIKELLKDETLCIRDIANKLSCSENLVSRVSIATYGAGQRPGSWSTRKHDPTSVSGRMTDEWIQEHYIEKGWTYQRIGDHFGVSRERIRQILHKKGYTGNMHNAEARYWLNKKEEGVLAEDGFASYFNEIDTEEKAYWLGYMIARGRVAKKNDYGLLEVYLNFPMKRKPQTDELLKAIGITGLEHKTTRSTIDDKPYVAHFYIVRSHTLAERLQELHIESPKYESAQMPTTLPYELQRHFFRGYYEGKGFIWENKKHGQPGSTSKAIMFMYGSFNLLDDFMCYLVGELGVEFPEKAMQVSSEKEWDHHRYCRFYSGSMERNVKIFDHLYDGATVYNEEKYKQYRRVYHNEE